MQTAREMALAEAARAGIDPNLFLRLIQQESKWDPTATSPVGAFGLTQAMPATWAKPGFGVQPGGDRNDPKEQLRFGADYAAAMLNRYPNDTARAMAAYNWGAGNADKWSGDPSALPEETRNYINIVANGLGAGTGGNTPATIASMSTRSQDPNSIMSEPEDNRSWLEKTTIHPGVGLQALGAALAASARGESAAGDIAKIRQRYFDQQERERKIKQAETQRKALSLMLGDYPKLQAALDDGADPNIIMNVYSQLSSQQSAAELQQAGFANQRTLQEDQQAYLTNEHALDRETRIDLAEKGFEIDWARVGTTNRLNEAQIDNWKGVSEDRKAAAKEDARRWNAQFGLETTKFNAAESLETVQGKAAQDFIASTYERLGDKEAAENIRSQPPSAFADSAMVGQFQKLMSMPYGSEESRTAAAKDWGKYQELRQKAAQEPDPTVRAQKLADAEMFWSSVNHPSTQINMGDKAAIEWTRSNIKRSDADLEATASTFDTVALLDNMLQTFEENPDMDMGVFYSMFKTPLDLVASLGIGPQSFRDAQSARYTMDQGNTRLAISMKTPGAVSNYEQDSWKASNPGVGTEEWAFKASVEQHKLYTQRRRARALYMRDKMESGEMSYAESEKAWNDALVRGDPETMPKFANFDKHDADNIKAIDPKIGDTIYIDGGTFTIENARDLEEAYKYLAERDAKK